MRAERETSPALKFESPADDHTESVVIDALDNGRGFHNAARDKASLPIGRLRRGVGEDEVVQTGDTAEGIHRDGAEFVEKISPTQESDVGYSSCLLSLLSPTPAGGRVKHHRDGLGGDRGEARCDGSAGELVDGFLHSIHPHIVGL